MKRNVLIIVFMISTVLTGCHAEESNNKNLIEKAIQKAYIASYTEKAEAEMQINAQKEDLAEEEPVELLTVFDDWSYSSKNMQITIEERESNGTHFFIADIVLLNDPNIKSAAADEIYHGDLREKTSDLAKEMGAVFAVNADYYVARNEGVIVRNGEAMRDKPDMDDTAMCINTDGAMTIVNECDTNPQELIDYGIIDSFSFGPSLLENGQAKSSFPNSKVERANPRTGVGQIEPGHLVFIVADGRQPEYSKGFTLAEFAQLFEKLGCQIAYNLDGGGSSTMYFNGRIVNKPANGEERPVYDAICIVDDAYKPEAS